MCITQGLEDETKMIDQADQELERLRTGQKTVLGGGGGGGFSIFAGEI